MAGLVADSVEGILALLPWTLQQAYFEGSLDEGQPMIHHGPGAVLFVDASGFTALTSHLASVEDGAAILAKCLSDFFSRLVPVIYAFRGDVIKFSGDAITVVFPAVDDTKGPKYTPELLPHGCNEARDLGPMGTAVLRASACAIEISKEYDTRVEGLKLRTHIGIGCGDFTVYQVGGACLPQSNEPQYEWILCGPALEQIHIAEPLSKDLETVLSPQAWEHIQSCVMEGEPIEDRPDFHVLLRLATPYDIASVRCAAGKYDCRADILAKFGGIERVDVNVLRQYVPAFPVSGSEMRNTSVVFIAVSGFDAAPAKLQEVVLSVQQCCVALEGALNKCLIDDKGLLFLLTFGLPPLEHPNDPARAVLACLDIAEALKKFDIVVRMGVTTGRNFCGLVGSPSRMEYTVLGDSVNLAARLMSNAPPYGILCDEETRNASDGEVGYDAEALSLSIKGKAAPVSAFRADSRKLPASL
jgi:class 3 adenylate cyclase